MITIPQSLLTSLKTLALPSLLSFLGAGRYLRERLIHVPGNVLPLAVVAASRQASILAAEDGRTVPNDGDRWRAQEIVQAMIAEGTLVSSILSGKFGVPQDILKEAL